MALVNTQKNLNKAISSLMALASVGMLLANNAIAEEIAAQTSTTAAPAAAPAAPASKISVSFASAFYGPSIAALDDSLQPDSQGGLSAASTRSPIFLKNYLSAMYKFNDKISAGPVLYFQSRPADNRADLGAAGEADLYQMRDPYLKAQYSNLIKVRNYSMTADLRYSPGVTAATRRNADPARNNHQYGYMMTKQVHGLEIPNSDLSFGAVTYLIWNLYEFSTDASGALNNDFIIGAAPSLSYKLADNLTFNLAYEMEGLHKMTNTVTNWNNSSTDLAPSLSWDITPTVNVEPGVVLYTGNRVSWETTQFTMSFSWKLL